MQRHLTGATLLRSVTIPQSSYLWADGSQGDAVRWMHSLEPLYPNRARKFSITYVAGWKAVKSWYIQRIKYHRNYGPCDYWQDCLTATFLYRSILFLSISHIVAPSIQLQPTSHSMYPHHNLGLKIHHHGERILWISCQGHVRHLSHYTIPLREPVSKVTMQETQGVIP